MSLNNIPTKKELLETIEYDTVYNEVNNIVKELEGKWRKGDMKAEVLCSRKEIVRQCLTRLGYTVRAHSDDDNEVTLYYVS